MCQEPAPSFKPRKHYIQQGVDRVRKAVQVIPVEIEVPSEIDTFAKREILVEYGRTYPKWIQDCYLHRMREILKNPAEFGKLVLEEKKRDHRIQDYDLED